MMAAGASLFPSEGPVGEVLAVRVQSARMFFASFIFRSSQKTESSMQRSKVLVQHSACGFEHRVGFWGNAMLFFQKGRAAGVAWEQG